MGKETANKGPRPKHVPQRTCIACRRVDAKRGLIRLVRSTEDRVGIDTSGKAQGRGAYLCHDPLCWDAIIKRRGIERALKIERLADEDRDTLMAFARRLAPAGAEKELQP
jgi:hypothetical protein